MLENAPSSPTIAPLQRAARLPLSVVMACHFIRRLLPITLEPASRAGRLHFRLLECLLLLFGDLIDLLLLRVRLLLLRRIQARLTFKRRTKPK